MQTWCSRGSAAVRAEFVPRLSLRVSAVPPQVTPARHERQAIKFSARLDPAVAIAPLPEFGDPLPQYATTTQLELIASIKVRPRRLAALAGPGQSGAAEGGRCL